MDVGSLLKNAEQAGVAVSLVNDRVRFKAPRKLTRFVEEQLIPYEAELRAHLRGEVLEEEPDDDEPAGAVLAPASPFPIEALPGTVGEFVAAQAAAIGCDPSFIALPLLACLARAVGNKRVIELKPGWREPAIIWAAIVGKSGTHKTPALYAATQFLERLQARALAEHKAAVEAFAQEQLCYERDVAAWRRLRDDVEPPPWPPTEPHCERFITNDATIEAIADFLGRQYDGVLVVRDELTGWLESHGQYKGGKGGDCGHFLSCWSARPMTVDRKTGDVRMSHIPRASVSVVGGIQPAILKSAIGREHLKNGLCARLLFAMPETRPQCWSEASVDPHLEAALDQVFAKLFALGPAADADGRPAPYPLRMTPEAKALWVGDRTYASWSRGVTPSVPRDPRFDEEHVLTWEGLVPPAW